MFENEDVILPDDFEAPSQVEEITEQVETPVETDTQPQVTETTEGLESEQNQQIPTTFKIKYNHDEQELSYDEAIPLIQKGMNYDKQVERLQQLENDPRITFIQELAEQNNMTPDEYIEAVRQERERQAIDELVQNNIPEEYAREMLESRKFRQQLESERQTKAQNEKQNSEYLDFFNYYKEVNGKDFDPQKDEIPTSVWEANKNGVPLKYAFMEHQNNQYKSQLQTLKQNESNTKKAVVGGLTQHGSTEVAVEDDFLSGFNSI